MIQHLDQHIATLRGRWLHLIYQIIASDPTGDFFERIGLPASATLQELEIHYRTPAGLDVDGFWRDVHRHEPTRRRLLAMIPDIPELALQAQRQRRSSVK